LIVFHIILGCFLDVLAMQVARSHRVPHRHAMGETPSGWHLHRLMSEIGMIIHPSA
jgi:hypothetical protein